MSSVIWIGLAAFVAAFLLRSMLTSSVDRAMRAAIQTNDVNPLVVVIADKPKDTQATLLNHTIKRLWEGYHRELAARLVRRVAPSVAEASITHYWIQKCLEVEPDMAAEHLDVEFLVEHYRPDLAARCGAGG